VPAPTRHAGNTNDAPAATETTRNRYDGYAVEWDACPGSGPGTQLNGTLQQGVWWVEHPKPKPAKGGTTGAKTVGAEKRRPIPRIRRRR